LKEEIGFFPMIAGASVYSQTMKSGAEIPELFGLPQAKVMLVCANNAAFRTG
jgi:hypothetical protein